MEHVGYDVGQMAARSLNQIAAHYAELYDFLDQEELLADELP